MNKLVSKGLVLSYPILSYLDIKSWVNEITRSLDVEITMRKNYFLISDSSLIMYSAFRGLIKPAKESQVYLKYQMNHIDFKHIREIRRVDKETFSILLSY